jgi:hypothetical protein
MVESQWRALYKAALLELDPKQLQARTKAAEDVIHARISDARVPRDERMAMEEALLTLSILKGRKSWRFDWVGLGCSSHNQCHLADDVLPEILRRVFDEAEAGWFCSWARVSHAFTLLQHGGIFDSPNLVRSSDASVWHRVRLPCS